MNFHICPLEVTAFLASLPVIKWLWHCCKECLQGCSHKESDEALDKHRNTCYNQGMTTKVTGAEQLLTWYSEGWQCHLPVTLFTYSNGSMDLHAQTGEGHTDAIKRAEVILAERGLKVSSAEFLGPSGIYYSVTPLTKVVPL